jgi:hypothetical protein
LEDLERRVDKLSREGRLQDVAYEGVLQEYRRATGVDWEEVPADMKTFIDDPEYSDFKQFLWPAVRGQLMEIAESYESGLHDDWTLEEPIGSGKSETAACLGAWLIHRLLCMRDPQAHFKIAPGNFITVLCMSRSSEQAKRIVFHKIHNRVRRSPWFKARGYLPDTRIKSELRFRKGVVCYPGNSHEEVALGYDIIYATLDEANRFQLKTGHDNAVEVHNELKRRITSRFIEYREGLIVAISSSTHDLSFTRRREADPTTVYRRRTILDMWPSSKLRHLQEVLHRGHPYMVPRRLVPEMQRNSDVFFRDFYSVAASGEHPYMPDYEWLLDHAAGEPAWSEDSLTVENWLVPTKLGLVGKRQLVLDSRPRFVHVDLGHTRDSAGFAVAHVAGDCKRADEYRPLVSIDVCGRIDPRQTGGEVNFAYVRGLIYDLRRRGFNVYSVTYDGFASEESIQQLKLHGYKAEEYSVDREMTAYEELKECLLEGRLIYPKQEALLREISRLQHDPVRDKVDHPEGGSKDMADAVAGAVHWAMKAGVGGYKITFADLKPAAPRVSRI